VSIFTTFRLADPLGNHLKEIATYHSFSYVLNCAPGAVGVLELELPRSFNTSLLLRDGRIGPWRAISGRPPYNDNGAQFTIETLRYRATYTFVRAYHMTGLLDRRIIAYAAGSSYAKKAAAAADDQLKTFWKENAGASIVGADRDGVETQADISAYVATQANLGAGASVAKAAARRRLLAVAQELSEASARVGTYMTFEIIAPTETTLELRTYTTQRGVDRRASSSNPIILREQAGVLENAQLEIDYHNEKTFVIAGGQGEGTERLIATAADTTRMGLSPFGRVEDFADMSNVNDTTSLQDDADSSLYYGRPLITFTGDLIETPALTRGIQFDLGDLVTAEDPQTHQQYDVRLDRVSESMDSSGRKTEVALRNILAVT
jgi:ReqiPepy6 Gp37-like protein